MKIVTGNQMRDIDRITIEEYGFPPSVLMENAGRTMARWILEICPADAEFLVFCGSGNNGGDGLVVARYLFQAGYPVRIFLTGNPENLSPDSRTNYNILKALGLPVNTRDAIQSSDTIPMSDRTWIVDAILGTGLQGDVRGDKKKLISWINKQDASVVSLDIPSGLISDGNSTSQESVIADHTLTVEIPKSGMLTSQSCGKLAILKCGFPGPVVEDDTITREWYDSKMAKQHLPHRTRNSHKNNNGDVLIIAGSRKYFGAALLAAMGVQSGGAGLIRLAYPTTATPTPTTVHPWLITVPVDDSGLGVFTEKSIPQVRKMMEQADSCVIGPGMDRKTVSTNFLKAVLPDSRRAVLDADALWHLHRLIESGCRAFPDDTVLTPHPGELNRLLHGNCSETAIRNFSCKYNTTVTAKDWVTRIFAPNGRMRTVDAGHPALAVGGTGDVLAGLTAALFARGLGSFEAAALAVFLHGSAGTLLAEERGEDGLDPVLLADTIPLMRDLLYNTADGAPGAGQPSRLFSMIEQENGPWA